MALRTVPLPPATEKTAAPGIFTAGAADAVRDALARQIVTRPVQVAEALYLLGLSDGEVYRLCDVLLALDANHGEGRAA